MADEAALLRVTVATSPGPREVREWSLQVGPGSRVRDALARCGLEEGAGQALALFVWGRAASPEQLLREGDRIELLRGLRVDPKVARRERFRRQGARAAGLFARKKPD